ncbi:alanine racemase [Enemella dayhoffiae]|uniref:Alanine racemase n=1 Tax=Enemella dayhoffiae TaxID=2016507 RepID=A0A255GTC4_9ACTN|nr:alanine racemase [Enemella dayhoffiae]
MTLTIDVDRWRQHLRRQVDRTPGLVPVAKGNGYGFGLSRLAAEATALGLDTLAVGTPGEAASIKDEFAGDIVIMLPWEPNDPHAVAQARDPRVVVTVSRLTDLEVLANLGGDRIRVLVEVLTSMKRHGLPSEDLQALAAWQEFLQLDGWTIHLPLAGRGNRQEAETLARMARDVADAPVWFSHLSTEDYQAVNAQLGAGRCRLRMGTQLWLGDPGALKTTATVLDVHPVKRGERMGYWQRPSVTDGYVVVVSGGTSNGIGLEAPSAVHTVRQRAISFATGGLEAAGLALSPFTIGGSKRWFVEPPHMQTSLVFLPSKVDPPQVGEEIPVEVRNTIATFDNIVEA